MNKEQKFERFAEREMGQYLSNIIFENNDGKYVAFGTYYIKDSAHGVEVRTPSDEVLGCFTNKRSALGFCTADKYNKLNLAIQIRNLDSKKRILSNDLTWARRAIGKSKSNDFVDTVESKSLVKTAQYEAVCKELEKCLNSAKYLQIKGFQHETARVFSN